MYYLSDFCCLCLSHNKILTQLSTTDNDNITYLSKIISSVPEMNCSVMNNQRLLCKECCDNINTTYKFRQRWLRSKTMLIDYISQLRSVSNVSGKISVRLTDFRLQQSEVCIKSEVKNEVIDTLSLVNVIKTEPNEAKIDYISQLRSVSNVSGKNSIRLTDFRQQDKVCIKSEEKNEVIDTLSLVNVIKTEPNEGTIDYISQLHSVSNVSGKIGVRLTDFRLKQDEVCVKSEEKGVIDTLSLVNIIKTEPNEGNFSDIDYTEMDHKSFLYNYENADETVHLEDNNLDFKITIDDVNIKLENESEMTRDNLNLLNKIKPELSEINTIEEIIIKTEVNENYIDENTDFLDSEEKIKSKTTKLKCSNECTVCKKTFINRYRLDTHMRTHTGERPYVCTICKKAFTISGTLNDHMRTHSGQHPHECTVCKKTFTKSGHLKEHMRTHTGERPYVCTICSKTFAYTNALIGHMRTHTGERPYECTECKKTFNSASTLINHVRIHKGERPYVCTICKKTFVQSGHLSIHMRIHTGELPFQCDFCNKRFTNSSCRSKHLKIHTGERPYKCETCNKTFIQPAKLKRHMKIHTDKSIT